MLRSKTVNHIRDLAAQGYSIRRIADETGIARNTIRKYLRGKPEPVPRRKRTSKLDPFEAQIRRWIDEDHLYNCQTMFERLHPMGYPGGLTILRQFVQPLRPARRGRSPVIRYETPPGAQIQLDWGEFFYEEAGVRRKLYGLTTVLAYSRMRFVVFFKRCDTASLIRGLMAALESYGGTPRVLLTDRMKSVLVAVEDGRPKWNARFADFAASTGFAPRVCRSYTPQTKGKVERAISVVKTSFWAGIHFTDLDDLNGQALAWCEDRNRRLHQTTRCRPVDRLAEEVLLALPEGYAWQRYRCEERKVTWDGYVSYDGVLYGVPGPAALTGRLVLVGTVGEEVQIFSGGVCVAVHRRQAQSGEAVMHPEQFIGFPTAHAAARLPVPLGHLSQAPPLVRRPLDEYDALFGLGAGMSRADSTTGAPISAEEREVAP
jgi:transposase